MTIDSKADNERTSVSKMQTKWATMATSHRPPHPGTCHTVFKGKRQSYTEQDHEGKTAKQWHNYACPRRSFAFEQQISQLTLIVGNLSSKVSDTLNCVFKRANDLTTV